MARVTIVEDAGSDVYDDADIASAFEMAITNRAIEETRAKAAPESHPDFDGESCLDCGDTIIPLRLSLGRIRCVVCQERLEKKSKMFGSAG